MKYTLIAIVALVGALTFSTAYAEAAKSEPQKVCIDKIGKDGKTVTGKDGKPVQECKKMKVHKKLEDATPAPVKK